jgi:hypothetical protein
MKLLIVVLTAVFGLAAHANARSEAQFAKTFPFPVSSLEKIEQSMATAAARTGKSMQQEVDFAIDSNFALSCAEESPIQYEGHLYGCVLGTTVDVNGTQILLRNLVYLQQSSAEVRDLLAKTDVNKVDSVDLTTPFDGGHGSRYFCNAEGTPGARQWACYLYFVD